MTTKLSSFLSAVAGSVEEAIRATSGPDEVEVDGTFVVEKLPTGAQDVHLAGGALSKLAGIAGAVYMIWLRYEGVSSFRDLLLDGNKLNNGSQTTQAHAISAGNADLPDTAITFEVEGCRAYDNAGDGLNCYLGSTGHLTDVTTGQNGRNGISLTSGGDYRVTRFKSLSDRLDFENQSVSDLRGGVSVVRDCITPGLHVQPSGEPVPSCAVTFFNAFVFTTDFDVTPRGNLVEFYGLTCCGGNIFYISELLITGWTSPDGNYMPSVVEGGFQIRWAHATNHLPAVAQKFVLDGVDFVYNSANEPSLGNYAIVGYSADSANGATLGTIITLDNIWFGAGYDSPVSVSSGAVVHIGENVDYLHYTTLVEVTSATVTDPVTIIGPQGTLTYTAATDHGGTYPAS